MFVLFDLLKKSLSALSIKKILFLLLFFFASCESTQQSLIPDFPNSFPDNINNNRTTDPIEEDQIKPTTIASPPILFLKAQGHFREEEGLFYIRGEVNDENDNPVDQAIVKIENERTQQIVQTFTQINGSFEGIIPVQIGDRLFVQARLPDLDTQSNVVEFTVVKDFLFLDKLNFTIIDLQDILFFDSNPASIKIPYSNPNNFSLSHDEHLIYFIYHKESVLRIFNIESQSFLDLNGDGYVTEDDAIELPNNPYDIHVDPQGRFIYIAYDATYFTYGNHLQYHEGNKIRVIDLESYQVVDRNQDGFHNIEDDWILGSQVRDVVFDAENNLAYILSDQAFLYLIDTLNHEIIESIHLPVSHFEGYVYSNSYINDLDFWNNQILVSVIEQYDKTGLDNDAREVCYNFILDAQNLNLLEKKEGFYCRAMTIYDDRAYVYNSRTIAPNVNTGLIINASQYSTYFPFFSIIDLDDNKVLYRADFFNLDLDYEFYKFIQFDKNNQKMYIRDTLGHLMIKEVSFINDNPQIIEDVDYIRKHYDYDIGRGVILESQINDPRFLYVFNRRSNNLKQVDLSRAYESPYKNRIYLESINEFIFGESDYLQSKTLRSSDQRYTYYLFQKYSHLYMVIIDNLLGQYVDINSDGVLNREDIIELDNMSHVFTDAFITEDDEFLYLSFMTHQENHGEPQIRVYNLRRYEFVDLNQDGLKNYNDSIIIPFRFQQPRMLGAFLKKIPNKKYFVAYFNYFGFLIDSETNKIVDLNHDQFTDELDVLSFNMRDPDRIIASHHTSGGYVGSSGNFIYLMPQNTQVISDNMGRGIYIFDLETKAYVDFNEENNEDDNFLFIDGNIKNLVFLSDNSMAIFKYSTSPYKLTVFDFNNYELVDLQFLDDYQEEFNLNQDVLFLTSPDNKYLYVFHAIGFSWKHSIFSIIDLGTYQRVDRNGDGVSDRGDDIFIDFFKSASFSPDGENFYIYSASSPLNGDQFIIDDIVDLTINSFDSCSIKSMNTKSFDFNDINEDGIYDYKDEFVLGQCPDGNPDINLSYNGDHLYTVSGDGFHVIDLSNKKTYIFPLNEVLDEYGRDFVYDSFSLNIPW